LNPERTFSVPVHPFNSQAPPAPLGVAPLSSSSSLPPQVSARPIKLEHATGNMSAQSAIPMGTAAAHQTLPQGSVRHSEAFRLASTTPANLAELVSSSAAPPSFSSNTPSSAAAVPQTEKMRNTKPGGMESLPQHLKPPQIDTGPDSVRALPQSHREPFHEAMSPVGNRQSSRKLSPSSLAVSRMSAIVGETKLCNGERAPLESMAFFKYLSHEAQRSIMQQLIERYLRDKGQPGEVMSPQRAPPKTGQLASPAAYAISGDNGLSTDSALLSDFASNGAEDDLSGVNIADVAFAGLFEESGASRTGMTPRSLGEETREMKETADMHFAVCSACSVVAQAMATPP